MNIPSKIDFSPASVSVSIITTACVMCASVQETIIAPFALVCRGFLTCSNSGTSA